MATNCNNAAQSMAIPVVIGVIASIRDKIDDNLHESGRFARLLPVPHLFAVVHAFRPSETFPGQNCGKL